MYLRSFRFHGIRNLAPTVMELAPGLNLVSGSNGAGKSALLEALQLLATGQSFRASRIKNVMGWDGTGFLLAGDWEDPKHGFRVRSEHRFDGKDSLLQLGSTNTNRLEFLKRFPTVFVGAESLKFFDEGPTFRRRQLDRGGFHVEHSYLNSWRRYRRALTQRNRLLKQREAVDRRLLSAWTEELDAPAAHLGECRRLFVASLTTAFEQHADACGLVSGLTLEYRPGWDPSVPLRTQLEASIAKDSAAGYTLRGPHRDDLSLMLNKRVALNSLSRGQQKSFMLAFFFALSEVIRQTSGNWPLLLLDDLGAELDHPHQRVVLEFLNNSAMQSLVTSTEGFKGTNTAERAPLFHVKHQRIYKCYNGALTTIQSD